jgi:TP901 family phage tail tape measure protein
MAGKFSLAAIFSAVDKLSAPLAKIQTKLGAFGKSAKGVMRGVNGAVDKGLAGIGKFSNAIGIAGVASLAGLGLELTNVMQRGAEFEKVLVRTGTAFETPVKQGTKAFAELTAAARRVGQTTEFSALQGAEGLNSLATAGYDSKQSIAALPKIIDFASAGGLELAQASDIASDSLGAFGLRSADAAVNANNMARVMDSLTRAAADSTTNTAELFEGIRMGGAFAATSGASIEQFVGMLGVLANKGIKGSEAGTAVRNSFLHLTKPTKEASDTMARLGIKIAKTETGAIDMAATIGRFTKATAKLTKTQKAAAIAAVFGAYTVGPFLSLMDAGEGTIRDFTKNLEHATGVTRTMAETMRESSAAKIARFFNILDDARLTVFAAMAPTVLEIAGSIGKWVTANQQLIGTKTAEWATKLKDSLPVIWIWTVRAAKALAAFAVAAVAIKAVNAAVAAYQAATMLATAVAWTWNVAVTASTAAVNSAWLATVGLKIAQLASRAATLIASAAQFAYSAQLNVSTVAAVRMKVAELASRIALLASRAATVIATAAQTVYATVLALSTGGLSAFKVAALASVPAIGAQVAALVPLMATLGAATAAVAALVFAWSQYNALDKDLAGSGGIGGTVGKMWDMGTFDPFKAHDAAMNEKAMNDRNDRDLEERDRGWRDRERPQVVSPQARAAAETAEAAAAAGGHATVDGKITVEQKQGTKATAKAGPKSPPIVVKRSGAFPS